MKRLSAAEQHTLLQLGVRTRIRQLEEELKRLRRFSPGKPTTATPTTKSARPKMTPAQRKALSLRMKEYWKNKSVKERNT